MVFIRPVKSNRNCCEHDEILKIELPISTKAVTLGLLTNGTRMVTSCYDREGATFEGAQRTRGRRPGKGLFPFLGFEVYSIQNLQPLYVMVEYDFSKIYRFCIARIIK